MIVGNRENAIECCEMAFHSYNTFEEVEMLRQDYFASMLFSFMLEKLEKIKRYLMFFTSRLDCKF